MEIDNFSVEEDEEYWELYLGRTSGLNGLHGHKIIKCPKTQFWPDEKQTKMILERLNGFPKAIEFLYELSKVLEGSKIENEKRVGEHIDEFLSAVPHQHSLLKQEEPRPREFRVDFEVVRKGHICVTATTREEAEQAAMETSAQEDLYEYLGREEAQHGDEASDVRITRVEEAE